MENIVIAGAGPVGLYVAIRLSQIAKQRDLQVNVTVIDPRVGDYRRPGIVANMALSLLSQHIGKPITSVKDGDDTGTSMFIQDLEKALYVEAKQEGVNLVRASFDGFGPKTVLVNQGQGGSRSLPCDIALDCSGARRALVKKFNETEPSRPFEIKDVGNNPLKNHFIAYVCMDFDNAEKISEKKHRDPVRRVLALERLRSEFGWTQFVEPEISWRRYTMKGSGGEGDTVRFYLYFEVPERLMNASRDEQLAWLKALIDLKTERNDVEFEVEAGAMKFGPFLVDPHKVVQPVLSHDKHAITVIPCGDAQIEPDYRIGVGIWSGIQRANALLQSIFTNDRRELLINTKQYEMAVQAPMGVHESELQKDYRVKRASLREALETERGRYANALPLAINQKDKAIIQSGLNEIDARIAIRNVNQYLVELMKVVSRKDALNQNNLNENLESLKNYEEALSEALDDYLKDRLHGMGEVQTELLELINVYNQVAAKLFSNQKFSQAELFYRKAIDLYLKYFPGLYPYELAKLYSNCAIIMNKEQNFEQAIHMADRSLEALSRVASSSDRDKLVIKVRFNQCAALLGSISNLVDQKENSLFMERLEAAEKIYKEIKSSPDIGSAGLDGLSKKFETIHRKHSG